MPIDTVAALVEALKQYHVLEAMQLSQVSKDQSRFTDPRVLAKDLMQRGWLTTFQINRLFQNRAQDLLLGSYLLLEPLGEGGMGTVYRARHLRLDRVDALKVIRKNILANKNAVHRFHREAKAAARLSHPNVVTVYDAGESGDTHFLAMEYVAGTDLSKLVKTRGPLPVSQACDYIRQAALGLQHAHERGLIHRDIKPANLLLAPNGLTIKVLDLGLARLSAGPHDSTAESLTDTGAVVGTPDFIAPEQARNAHDIDIRADIYSLGCTLYYLLIGKIPFTGETLTEKLIKHQLEEPEPVQRLRPDVQAGVLDVLHRMMAKRPDDRYQTPAQVSAALLPYVPSIATEDEQIQAAPPVANGPPLALPVRSFPGALPDTAPQASAELRQRLTKSSGRILPWIFVGAGGLVLLFVMGLGAAWWAFARPHNKTVVVATSAKAPSTSTRIDPEQAKVHFERGNGHLSGKSYDQAIAEYTEAIRVDPKLAAAYNNRGLAHRHKGATDLAMADFDKAIQLNPNLSDAYFNRAAIYYDRRDFAKCLADNDRVIALRPEDAAAYSNRGTIYILLKLHDKAIADFTKAVQIDPKYTGAWNNRGNAYIDKGDFDKAIEDFSSAIRNEPKNAASYNYRGYAYLLKKDYKEALAQFDRAIQLNSKYALAYLNRSDAHMHLGNPQLADADYQTAVRLDPKLARR
jgi:serine/threonine-protein kinase